MIFALDIPNPLEIDQVIAAAIPFFIVLIFLELWVRYKQERPRYDTKDALASIAMGAGSAVINLGIKVIVVMAFSLLYQYRFFTLDSTQWWYWALLFFADDFSFYLHHRSCHEIRLFWAAHVNHHSSTNYNLAVALRQSWGELFHKYIWWLWMPLVGFHPLHMIMMMSISLIYQFILHTEVVKTLGPLEWVLNTPSHHRVHHASNVRYLDRNHAGVLIIWDRLFGTFAPERADEPVVYGITTNIHTYNPIEIATHEYRNLWHDVRTAPGLLNKLKYIFAPPGWSHDGHSKTAAQMRADAGLL